MPVCSIVKLYTITPRCRGRPDVLLHEELIYTTNRQEIIVLLPNPFDDKLGRVR